MNEHHDDRPERSDTLASVLREGAAALRAEAPPPRVEQDVLAAFDAARRQGATAAAGPSDAPPVAALRPRRGWRISWPHAGALAALACALVLSVLLALGPPPEHLDVARSAAARADPFVALVPAHRLAASAAQPTQAWVVTAELPQERLAALGLPYDPARAGERVRAQLLVRTSGEVLAVRFVE
jgi:hypothetical protein